MARSIYERKAQKELEAEGFRVDWKTRPFRVPRGYQVDFFGLFDLIAYKFGAPLRWISIKGRAGVPSSHRKDVGSFRLPSETNRKEIWHWKRSKSWVKEIIP